MQADLIIRVFNVSTEFFTSRKGVCLIVTTIVVAKVLKTLRPFSRSGPYTPSVTICNTISRVLLNHTRKDVSIQLYPLDSIGNVSPVRHNDNGHAVAGAVRDEARRSISAAIEGNGWSKFEINPVGKSLDDEHRAHPHVAPGDLALEYRVDTPKPGSVVVCIDTDYYVENWDKWLGGGNPAIMHSFAPTNTAGYDGECPFTIRGDTVEYCVPGGGKWSHQLWDWCAHGEYVLFNSSGFLVGLWERVAYCAGFRKYTVSKVHHARPWSGCPHRILVWVLPSFSFWGHVALPSQLNVRRLSRVRFTDTSRPLWNTIVFSKEGQRWINFGRQGEMANASLPKEQLDTLMALGSEQSVTTRCLQMKISDQPRLSLIGQFYKNAPGLANNPDEIARPYQIRVHWPKTTYADVPEINYRMYANPVVSDTNLIPMNKRWEALSAAIDHRVTNYINTKVPPARFGVYAQEFSRHIVPDELRNTGVPYSWEETRDLLNKPSQVNAVKAIWETVDADHRRKIESFLKKEPCNKDGRIISSFKDARFLLGMSRFTLAFRDRVLHDDHNSHWFCPGLTPAQITDKLIDYVTNIRVPVEGDFENLDGTASAWHQKNVMRAPIFRYFHQRYHKEMLRYWDMLIQCPSVAKLFGFAFDSGPGVKSGSPTTCDENTILDAFSQYVAIRETRPDLTPAEAFAELGIALGDDSVFEQAYQRAWCAVCKAMGLKLKVEVCKPETGVTFLSRVFPDPWHTRTSFQDPLRTFRKLHLTGRDPNVPLPTAAIDRLSGYLVTDGLTPVISEYAEMVISHYENIGEAESKAKRESRASHVAEKPYWLTTGGSWPQDEGDDTIMLNVIAARTGLAVERLSEFRSQMKDPGTTPWSEFTFNRDEEPVPYKNTLDPDGQPIELEVDLRVLEEEQDRTNERAMARRDPEVVNPSPGVSTRGSQQNVGRSRSPRQERANVNTLGPTGDAEVRRQGNGKDSKRHGGIPKQRNSPGVVVRGTVEPNRVGGRNGVNARTPGTGKGRGHKSRGNRQSHR